MTVDEAMDKQKLKQAIGDLTDVVEILDALIHASGDGLSRDRDLHRKLLRACKKATKALDTLSASST